MSLRCQLLHICAKHGGRSSWLVTLDKCDSDCIKCKGRCELCQTMVGVSVCSLNETEGFSSIFMHDDVYMSSWFTCAWHWSSRTYSRVGIAGWNIANQVGHCFDCIDFQRALYSDTSLERRDLGKKFVKVHVCWTETVVLYNCYPELKETLGVEMKLQTIYSSRHSFACGFMLTEYLLKNAVIVCHTCSLQWSRIELLCPSPHEPSPAQHSGGQQRTWVSLSISVIHNTSFFIQRYALPFGTHMTSTQLQG